MKLELEAFNLDLVPILFSAFSVALQVDPRLFTLAEIIFLGALGVGIIAIMIAPFIRLLRDSERTEQPQRKRNRSLKGTTFEDTKEENFETQKDSAFTSDFIYEDTS